MTLGEKIRQAREKKKLSVAELARQLGVSRPAIDAWEKDASPPRRDKVPKLVKVLGLELTDFNPYGGGGVTQIDPREKRPMVMLIQWSDLRRIKEGKVAMGAVLKPKYVEASGAVPTDCIALRVDDNSMEPTFYKGELIFMDPAAIAKDGEYVIAKLGDERHVLRTYIPRRNGFFDLQAENAEFPTITVNSTTSADIKGVVVEHHKRYRR